MDVPYHTREESSDVWLRYPEGQVRGFNNIGVKKGKKIGISPSSKEGPDGVTREKTRKSTCYGKRGLRNILLETKTLQYYQKQKDWSLTTTHKHTDCTSHLSVNPHGFRTLFIFRN